MNDCYLSPLQEANKQIIVLKIATFQEFCTGAVKHSPYGFGRNFYGASLRRKAHPAQAELLIAAGVRLSYSGNRYSSIDLGR